MASGPMRESVTFQRRGGAANGGSAPLLSTDGMGGTSGSSLGDGEGGQGAWGKLCGPFRARLRPINGREEVLAGKLSGVQPFELIVRYCSDTAGVNTGDQAVDRAGVAYDITAIQNPDERQQWLSMIVKAGEPSDG